MNIFCLHDDPFLAAELLCDQHVSKMILESTQLLNNTLPKELRFYRTTHYNHPCSVWARTCTANARWLYDYTVALHTRYERSGKVHKCKQYLEILFDYNFANLEDHIRSRHVQCMPEEFKELCHVYAYNRYYTAKLAEWATRTDKRQIHATWKTSKYAQLIALQDLIDISQEIENETKNKSK